MHRKVRVSCNRLKILKEHGAVVNRAGSNRCNNKTESVNFCLLSLDRIIKVIHLMGNWREKDNVTTAALWLIEARHHGRHRNVLTSSLQNILLKETRDKWTAITLMQLILWTKTGSEININGDSCMTEVGAKKVNKAPRFLLYTKNRLKQITSRLRKKKIINKRYSNDLIACLNPFFLRSFFHPSFFH